MKYALAATALLSLLSLPGCAYPVMDRLLTSADQGITLAKQNDEAIFDLLEDKLDNDLRRIHSAFDADVDRAALNNDPELGTLSPEWVKEAGKGYGFLLKNNFDERLKLLAMRQTALENLETTGLLVHEARSLNQILLSQGQRLQLLLERQMNKGNTTAHSSQGAENE